MSWKRRWSGGDRAILTATRQRYVVLVQRESDLLLILEATVLHELVHFFRRKFNEQARLNMANARGRDYEEAVARKFEKDTYGKYLTVCMPKTGALAK